MACTSSCLERSSTNTASRHMPSSIIRRCGRPSSHFIEQHYKHNQWHTAPIACDPHHTASAMHPHIVALQASPASTLHSHGTGHPFKYEARLLFAPTRAGFLNFVTSLLWTCSPRCGMKQTVGLTHISTTMLRFGRSALLAFCMRSAWALTRSKCTT